jgi:N-acyl-D-amino-acid deacylase
VYDLVIRGGAVVDGTGAGPVEADVAIEGDRIAARGSVAGGARSEIDATGCIICPGFVDIHTHSDFTLPIRPEAAAKLLQGVTTDCTGNCGFSPFPFPGGGADGRRHGVFFEPKLTSRWAGLAEYAADLNGAHPGINVAPMVGLGAIRLAVLGDRPGPATDAELRRMTRLVESAVEDGAVGASSGLIYAPGGFADVKELAAVIEPAARHGRLYATHMRNEAARLEEALEEALATAARAGCRLQVSHLKAFGRQNWGKLDGCLDRIDGANKGGMDVAFDVYPYTVGSTTLAALLPPSALDGGEDGLRHRLGQEAPRAELQELVRTGEKSLDSVILGVSPSRPELVGRRLLDAAAGEGVDPAAMVVDLVGADGLSATMLVDGMSEDDVRAAIRHPASMFGSDGWTMATDASHFVHPRDFGAAVRLLTRYARDEALLDLGTAVRKLTAAPAARLRLAERGVLVPGYSADVTIFNLGSLEETGTFTDPCRYPTGISHVLVNGVHAVRDGRLTGARGGRVLSINT